jgi:hypothetical protein
MNIRGLAILFGIVALVASAAAPATPACTNADAFAGGKIADDCVGPEDVHSSDAAQLTFINDSFGGGFTMIGKFDNDDDAFDGLAGWNMTVTVGDGDPWDFLFTVTSPIAGATVDFALLIKQSQDTIAYLFSGVTLDIDDGSWISTFTNPRGKTVQDYSHISGFYRVAPVPAPGTLGLIALSLLGVGLFRRAYSA